MRALGIDGDGHVPFFEFKILNYLSLGVVFC